MHHSHYQLQLHTQLDNRVQYESPIASVAHTSMNRRHHSYDSHRAAGTTSGTPYSPGPHPAPESDRHSLHAPTSHVVSSCAHVNWLHNRVLDGRGNAAATHCSLPTGEEPVPLLRTHMAGVMALEVPLDSAEPLKHGDEHEPQSVGSVHDSVGHGSVLHTC
jgi:hypothetical protein